MARYIDKDALVAEIERRISEIDKYYCDINCVYQRIEECKGFLSFLDTLEVKEIDEESDCTIFPRPAGCYSTCKECPWSSTNKKVQKGE